jgi:hypothetical protein
MRPSEIWLPADEDRWRAYLDTEDELVFYCPGCAAREFSDESRLRLAVRAIRVSHGG